jgi:hypothetical protein
MMKEMATSAQPQSLISPNVNNKKYTATLMVSAPSRVTSNAIRLAILKGLSVGGIVEPRHLKAVVNIKILELVHGLHRLVPGGAQAGELCNGQCAKDG